ncbi:MAG: hypothetical protein KIT40_12050 [Nitrospira sp.]|nr:hypothetical protein [Nitrospira sp.]
MAHLTAHYNTSPSSLTIAEHVVAFLQTCDIPSVIVGDTRQFPLQVDGDIDVVIKTISIDIFALKLFQYCSAHGLRCVQAIQHEDSCWYFILSLRSNDRQLLFVHPDVCIDFMRNCRLLLTADALLYGRIQVNPKGSTKGTFCVPAPAQAFIYYLFKKIDKLQLSDSQANYLSSQWALDPTGALAQLRRVFAETDALHIAKAAEHCNWTTVRASLPLLQKALRGRLRPSVMAWGKDLVRKVSRIRRPTGLHVVLLGSDGVGKSTIMDRIVRELEPAFRRTNTYHLWPAFGSLGRMPTPVTNPHGLAPRGLGASLLKLSWWWVVFTVGYLIEVLPRLVGSTLVVFDRYYYDLLVDPLRYRYSGPSWLVKWIGRCIPSPDILILLDAPPEVVQGRKREVSYTELTRQRAMYLKLVRAMHFGHVVDASQAIDDVVIEIESILLSYLERRVVKRFGQVDPL